MSRIHIIISFLLIIFSFSACKDDAVEVINDDSRGTSWLLFETGYSPGGGYVTNEIASDPSQTITFQSDSTFTSTIPGYTDYKFYRMKGNVISIYKLDKSIPSNDPSQSILNYSYTIEDGVLKLYYRYCTEGCHMAFRRIEYCNLVP